MKIKSILISLVLSFFSLSVLAVPTNDKIIPVDGKTYTIKIGAQYGDETYIVGKAETTDGVNYYSVPFKCSFYIKYQGNNGLQYTYYSQQIDHSAHSGQIFLNEIQSFITNRVLVNNRQDPYVQFWNDSCSTLLDGDTCINALKQGEGQPYIYITCNYTQ